jgi:hypothetical protein
MPNCRLSRSMYGVKSSVPLIGASFATIVPCCDQQYLERPSLCRHWGGGAAARNWPAIPKEMRRSRPECRLRLGRPRAGEGDSGRFARTIQELQNRSRSSDPNTSSRWRCCGGGAPPHKQTFMPFGGSRVLALARRAVVGEATIARGVSPPEPSILPSCRVSFIFQGYFKNAFSPKSKVTSRRNPRAVRQPQAHIARAQVGGPRVAKAHPAVSGHHSAVRRRTCTGRAVWPLVGAMAH